MVYLFGPKLEFRRTDATSGARLHVSQFCTSHDDPGEVATWLRQSNHTLVEYLTTADGAAQECKLYLDADDDSCKGSAERPPQAKLDAFLRKVVERMDAYMDILRPHAPEVSYVLAQRHGYCPKKKGFKMSLRAFVNGIRMVHYDIPNFVKALDREAGFFIDDKLWDYSVYKRRDQLVCAINGMKGSYHCGGEVLHDGRVLTPLDPSHLLDERILWYVVQHTEPTWRQVPPTPPEEVEIEVEEPTPDVMNDDDVTRLVACLGPATADDRDAWIRVGMLLKGLGGVNGLGVDAYFPAWVEFSKRGHDKFESVADCKATWRTLRPIPPNSAGALLSGGARQMTIATLRGYAKRDDPAGYRAWWKARGGAAVPATASTASTASTAAVTSPSLVAAIKAAVPELHASLAEDTCFSHDEHGIAFCCGEGDTRYILNRGTHRVIRTGDMLDVGGLVTSYPLGEHSLAFLDKNILPAEPIPYTCTEVSGKQTDIASDALPGVLVNAFHDGGHKYVSLKVKEGRKEVIQTAPTKMTTFSSISVAARQAALQRQLGPEVLALINNMTVVNNNTNNGTIINFNLDPEKDRHDDEELAKAVIAANPHLVDRIRFVPDLKSNNCNGIFYCDEETNVWAQRSSTVIEKKLLPLFENLGLGSADLKHVNSKRGRGDMVYCVASEAIDERFISKVDTNLDLFATAGSVFDSRVNGWRPIVPDDYAFTTTGWAYDAEAAKEKRGEVDAFLEQVLPVPEERRVVLAFYASLLSGDRNVKKFLSFTDKQGGDNGKSALSTLFTTFFGDYVKINTKFVCKGAFDKDKDSHDAGMEPMRGKRLLVAEELKNHMTLDEALLKRVTGGSTVRIEGRRCGSNEQFKYVWQAGIVLIFNEDDIPKFDLGDAAFMKRMLVVPMRSRFVTKLDPEDADEPFVFEVDQGLHAKFPGWCSALADVLLENRQAPILFENNMLPPDMLQWRHEVTTGGNPYAEWLDAHTTVTGVNDDYVLIADLKVAAGGGREFQRFAKAYFTGLAGVVIKDRGSVKVDGLWATKRGIVAGVVRK